MMQCVKELIHKTSGAALDFYLLVKNLSSSMAD